MGEAHGSLQTGTKGTGKADKLGRKMRRHRARLESRNEVRFSRLVAKIAGLDESQNSSC